MENATIITLGPQAEGQNELSVATFEEAFGEYSEARGRGRARRAERKAARQEKRMTRIARKDERKRARVETRQKRRQDKKVGRQQVRQAKQLARQERKTAKMAAKQDRRGQRMEMRQGRKLARKEMRLKRRDLGREEEPLPEDDYGYEQQGYDQGGYDQGGYEQQGGGYEQQGGGYEQQGGQDDYGYGQDQGGYEQQGGYAQDDYGYEEGGYDEGGYEEDYGGYDEGGYEEDYGGYDEGGYEEDYGFAGEEDSSEVRGGVKSDSRANEIARKIEWNKELAARLTTQRDAQFKKGNKDKVAHIDARLDNVMKRIAHLEAKASQFVNFEGEFESDFSNADGEDFYEARGRRMKQMKKAKVIAQNERAEVSPGYAYGRSQRAMQGRRMSRRPAVTPVQAGLNPQIGANRIVVPAQDSNFNGTSAWGKQEQILRAENNPRTRVVELQSNAEGDKPKRKIPWVGIGIGVAVAGIVIFALVKSKALKK